MVDNAWNQAHSEDRVMSAAHIAQVDNGQTTRYSKMICDEIEARLVEAKTESGNANADDNDVLSTWFGDVLSTWF